MTNWNLQQNDKMIHFINAADVMNFGNGKSNFISLSDSTNFLTILQNIPRTFEISTNNGSCYFNKKLIQDISPTIFNILQTNQNDQKYHLPIDNDEVLKKIEELCQGNLVTFKKKDIPGFMEINNLLHFKNSSDFTSFETKKRVLKISIPINYFMNENRSQLFQISTPKQVYFCNINGVFSSKVISDFIMANPDTNLFNYDYDGKMNEFQKICDFFNFEEISITVDDFDYLQKIAEDLKIDVISRKINQIYKIQEKNLAKINDNQTFVDSINELFEWIYQINELSVIKVANLIIQSHWSKTEEDVQELAAFIIQAIETDYRLHASLIDLLIQLDEKGSKKLKILIPFIKEKIMTMFSNNDKLCSFVYKSYSKGIISKEELFAKFKEKKPIKQNFATRYNSTLADSLYVWFLPELIESGCCDENYLTTLMKSNQIFAHDKIDYYKKMRDAGEPANELSKAIKNDDLDTVQSIISKMLIKNLSKYFINPDIFDPLYPKNLTFIDYSAAYGSLKCFKYFMLNHSNIDSNTFYYAINGGNAEIIKIVDNYLQENGINLNDNINILHELIRNHNNILFDWFFEQKISQKDWSSYYTLFEVINESASSGNVHALIALIDKGLITLEPKEKKIMFSLAAKNGFYLLLQFLHNVLNLKTENMNDSRLDCEYVTFGNLSIFKLYLSVKENNHNMLAYAVDANQTKMINYFFNELADRITVFTISAVLCKTLITSDELFYYYIERFKTAVPSIFDKFSYDTSLLETACKYNRIKPFYTIINSINNDKNYDFTNCFYAAACSNSMEMCKYLIEQKNFIRFGLILHRIATLPLISREIDLLVVNNSVHKSINTELISILKTAISSQNKNLVEVLIESNVFYEECLIDSVYSRNIDVVNIILKFNSNPSFINRNTFNGTALHIAIMKNNLEIVKRLLSVPSINPCLFDRKSQTPLMVAVTHSYFPIIKELLSFIGKNICMYKDSIEFLFDSIFRAMNTPNTKNWIEILDNILNIENISMFFVGKNQIYASDLFSQKSINLEIIQKLIKFKDIDINYISPKDGNTPLISSLKNQRADIAELLINDPRTDINLSNYNYESPLVVSVQTHQVSIIKLLLNHEKFNSDLSHADYAMSLSDDEILQIFLSSNSIDVNCLIISPRKEYSYGSNKFGYHSNSNSSNKYIDFINLLSKSFQEVKETLLIHAVKKQNLKIIELIINHPTFDKDKSNLKSAVRVSFDPKNIEFNNKFIELLCRSGLFNYCVQNTNILSGLLQNVSIEKIEELFNNQIFDIPDEKLVQFFTYSLHTTKKAINIMKFILNYDKKHNNVIDFKKRQFLTEIKYNGKSSEDDLKNCLENIVDFILQNGGDVNQVDINGYYPLQCAIRYNSIEFVQVLVNTKKVNFNQTIKRRYLAWVTWGNSTWGNSTWGNSNNSEIIETYLHAAAMQKHDIFKLILDCSCIDINAKNSNNETPLMIACQNLKRKNIELLFKKDSLDFHCRNVLNEDALDLVNKLKIGGNGENEKADEKILNDALTKEQYFEKLMNKIVSKKSYLNGGKVDYSNDDL